MCIVFGLFLLLNSGFGKISNKEKGQRFTFNVLINVIFFDIETARLSWLTEIEQKSSIKIEELKMWTSLMDYDNIIF